MRYEQARGSFEIAKFYEKNRKFDGALIYYDEVLLKDPGSSMAILSRLRIDEIKRRTSEQ